jgi:hemoglobin
VLVKDQQHWLGSPTPEFGARAQSRIERKKAAFGEVFCPDQHDDTRISRVKDTHDWAAANFNRREDEMSDQQSVGSLYTRLGGYDAIAATVVDLMPRLRGDPKLWVYWKGKSLESRRRGDQLLIDFLCAAFGGPVFYSGPDMKTSHQGLGITTEEWEITLDHIRAALVTLGVPERETADVLAAAESLKGDIVEG